MITTVVFDLDDTLYDELDYCRSGFDAVAESIADIPSTPSADHISQVLWDIFTSGNHKTTFNAALDKLGMDYDEQLIRRMIAVYRNHMPQIILPQDSREVLEQLHTNYNLALLTDGFLPAQQYKVQALRIAQYFKCIVYTEELGRDCWKPSPTGFEKILADLHSSGQNAVYIADNQLKDFIAPNKLGFSTIQLLRPTRIHTDKSTDPEANPQHVILKISELPALLHRL